MTEVSKGNTTEDTLARITLLSNLSTGLKNAHLLAAFSGLPEGDYLYEIFAKSVLSEIETIMNPAKDVPQDLKDAAKIAEHLKQQMRALSQDMQELNNANMLKVLGVLNHSLGGKSPQQHPKQGQQEAIEKENEAQQQQRQQQIQRQQDSLDDSSNLTVTRGNRTGLSW